MNKIVIPKRHEYLPLTHEPINKTAALVTGKAPECCQYTTNRKNNNSFFETPQPVYFIRDNLIGTRFGQFEVIGVGRTKRGYKHTGKAKSRMYLVRCSCGAYEYRRRKAMFNPRNKNDKCHSCRHVEYLRMGTNDPNQMKS